MYMRIDSPSATNSFAEATNSSVKIILETKFYNSIYLSTQLNLFFFESYTMYLLKQFIIHQLSFVSFFLPISFVLMSSISKPVHVLACYFFEQMYLID